MEEMRNGERERDEAQREEIRIETEG